MDDVRDIAYAYLQGVRIGGNGEITARCPFHVKPDGTPEKNPSFSMSLTKGVWQCFSCKEKGNLTQFLDAMGVAKHVVSERYGHLITTLEKNTVKKTAVIRQVAYEDTIPEELLGIFDLCPMALIHEGFTADTLQHFDVGFDEAHQRITFPLRDFSGRLIGISGRATGTGSPRYKVYDVKEYQALAITPVKTEKRLVLWNFHHVRDNIRGGGKELLIVEGFKACMWAYQAGIHNVVALLGSSITEDQALLIEEYRPSIRLMLDQDDAGIAGTIKVAERLRRALRVHVCRYQGRQPDSLTADHLRESVNNAAPYALVYKELKDVLRTRPQRTQ